jgi:hypothetical protein
MSPYAELLSLVRQQVITARDGDVVTAIGLMDARQRVLDSAAPVSAADEPLIRELLTLDRELAGYIRQRMLQLREQSLTLHRGQTAMRGYATYRRPPGDRLNAER